MGLREQKKEATKRTLLNKAYNLFKKYGVESVSIRKLASESGLGSGTYYNYFKTKDEILFLICDSIFAKSFAEVKIDKSASVENNLNSLVLSILQKMSSESDIIFYFVQIISNPDHFTENSPGRDFIEKHISTYSKLLFEIIPNKNKITNIELFSRLCWHQLITYVYLYFMDTSHEKIFTKKFLENSNKIMCHGILL